MRGRMEGQEHTPKNTLLRASFFQHQWTNIPLTLTVGYPSIWMYWTGFMTGAIVLRENEIQQKCT